MEKKRLIKILLLCLVLVLLPSSVFAPALDTTIGYHPASQIQPGEFATGDYTFPGNLLVTGFYIGSTSKSYGSIDVLGNTGGYTGTNYFSTGGTYRGTFMLRESDALSGVHVEGSGWKWYFGDNILNVPEAGAGGVNGGWRLGRWPAHDTNNEWLYLSTSTSTAAAPVYQNLAVGKLHGSTHVESTAFLYISDRSLKKNIQPIPNALERVQKLQGVNFQWKKDDKEAMGLIANDVENIFPEVVTTDSEGLKQLQYGNLVGALVEAIKEQQKEIDSLKQEIEGLKG